MPWIEEAPDAPVPCAWCATPVDAAKDDDALFVQLRRGVDDDDEWRRFHDLPFCTEAHARQWFASRPLPDTSLWEQSDDETWSIGDTVGCFLTALLVVAVLAGGVYGFYQLVERVAAAVTG